ncbi:MAG: hypothetical protein J0L75_03065 [Spirochaetes bacterium]|nr:hypothetical protein [Spirochaetota bacterium]
MNLNRPRILLPILLCLPLAAGPLEWGVNIHSGGKDPETLAAKLAERKLTCVRMDLWGNDPKYLARFRVAGEFLVKKGIKIEAVIYSKFSAGQARHQDLEADLVEVERTAYEGTRPQIERSRDLLRDFELQNEISLYRGIKAAGSTGERAADFDTPCGRLQAAVLRGMSKAVRDVGKEAATPLRIILGTTDRSFALLDFFLEQGVVFDVVGYHIYPWENHKPLDADPWFGPGGPLGQLARFDRPIRLNEFNAGEIYSGRPSRPTLPDYANAADDPVTEAGFRSLDKHLKELLGQTRANLEAVLFYEIWDEPHKGPPENRFGLYFDEALTLPKVSLLLAASYAGGSLSPAEKGELEKRQLGNIER